MIDTVALLLADRSPVLRYRALVEVDGVSPDDSEVRGLAALVGSSPEVTDALASTGSDPRSCSFALSRLAYVGIRRGHPKVDALAENIFEAQKPDGSWAAGGYYDWRTLQVALPLRGLCEAGYANDPRAERAFEWLIERRFEDGSWPFAAAAGRKQGAPGYRKLPGSDGCRTSTTGALACFAHHPERRTSAEARAGLNMLMGRETRDEYTIGYEIVRLLGIEPPRGFATFYARFDLAFILDIASRIGVSSEDVRTKDLIDFLESKRGPNGLWDHPMHPHLSRWLTFDLLASLRRIETGDWTGTDIRRQFTAYRKRRRRF